MIFRDCNSNILNDFIRIFESKNWNCVLYGEFCEKICVLARSENRESGTTAFQIIFLESSNFRTN